MSSIPWTFERRPDTRVTNIRLGMWLFLASEAMLFASLFFAYALLRMNAATWPDTGAILSLERIVWSTVLLILATRLVGKHARWTMLPGVLFLVDKIAHDAQLWAAGTRPSVNLMIALWYVLTGLHALHVAGGLVATVWLAATSRRVTSPHYVERVRALRLYWVFLDVIWLGIVACFSLR